ncbi:uncharacterized protein LAESUDRAFT_763695 [Laetiporus sulphureus 93-53]|uniref:Uncharacterized protein n=1 Tax=Laetiporus sulphureus 93-53 TaxID=1314785 RepID=A0A165BPS8_9APHY|nr:uncharacterized protein LAESUDRAFT_763695 [Laetiporus sulphureus 93-53]KZT01435.1 hypothetical protein LAESUDRAFT_763695 [Laetiporus sulphureus 93-53]
MLAGALLTVWIQSQMKQSSSRLPAPEENSAISMDNKNRDTKVGELEIVIADLTARQGELQSKFNEAQDALEKSNQECARRKMKTEELLTQVDKLMTELKSSEPKCENTDHISTNLQTELATEGSNPADQPPILPSAMPRDATGLC